MKRIIGTRWEEHPTKAETYTCFVDGHQELTATVWRDRTAPRELWCARVDVSVTGAVRTGHVSEHRSMMLARCAAEKRLREEEAT